MNKKRLCPVCKDLIVGRIDKKFCSDHCRNTFNNERYSSRNAFVQKVNRVLRKNYSILKELNKTGETKVSRSLLLQEGFDFNYFTGINETQKGDIYRICYDQEYFTLTDELILLMDRVKSN